MNNPWSSSRQSSAPTRSGPSRNYLRWRISVGMTSAIYAVSTLIAQKADILTLARIAGHSDPNVTLKVYGHLMKGALAKAADLYDPLAATSSAVS